MDTKTCFKCGLALARSEFYKHPHMADGLLGKCKECTRKDAQRHRIENLDKLREYDRARSTLPHRKAAYAAKNKAKRIKEGHSYNKSHTAVSRAVASGTLIVPDHCAVCLVQCKPQAHHDDYSKPLDVMWLCPVCHAARHVELGRIKKLTFLEPT
jgi:hypothetical protein